MRVLEPLGFFGQKFYNCGSYAVDRINPEGFENPQGFRIDFLVNCVTHKLLI